MNRNIRYILVGMLVLLWGIIFKKVFRQNQAITTKNQTFKDGPKSSVSTFKVPLDTHVLLLTYQNPFGMLNKSRIIEVENYEIDLEDPVRREPIPQELSITYLGLLYSERTQKHSVIVERQGRQYIVREGRLKDGIEFVSFKNNELRLRIDGVFKDIMISIK